MHYKSTEKANHCSRIFVSTERDICLRAITVSQTRTRIWSATGQCVRSFLGKLHQLYVRDSVCGLDHAWKLRRRHLVVNSTSQSTHVWISLKDADHHRSKEADHKKRTQASRYRLVPGHHQTSKEASSPRAQKPGWSTSPSSVPLISCSGQRYVARLAWLWRCEPFPDLVRNCHRCCRRHDNVAGRGLLRLAMWCACAYVRTYAIDRDRSIDRLKRVCTVGGTFFLTPLVVFT